VYAILTIIYIPTVLAIRFWIIGLRKKPIVREATLSIGLSAVMGAAIVVFSTGGGDAYRYSYPLLVVVFVIFISVFLENIEQNNLNLKLKTITVSGAVFVSLLLAIASHDETPGQSKTYLDNLGWGLRNVPLVTLDEREKYSKMLDSVPEGEIVLTRLDKPFLMNFKKHTIWIADLPGGASLPPGMPSFKGEEAVADYLVSQSIRYVAYSYANEANHSRKDFEDRLSPEWPFWLQNQTLNTFEFQESLQKLGESRKRIYDDGENFVIDLLKYKS
jgi:hypothetical protein